MRKNKSVQKGFAAVKRRLFPLAATVLLAACLSGCSWFGMDAENLMQPPKPTGEREAIYQLLEAEAASGFTLKYPVNGDYRSAIIMNQTGEEAGEAIAFFQPSGENVSGISVIFMKKTDGVWSNVGTFNNPATQIDKVEFGDVNADGKSEIIIGWGNTDAGSSRLYVYSFEGRKVTELNMDQSSAQMVVMDFDGDGYDEIFTAGLKVGEQPAVARLFRLRSGAIEIMGECALDQEVTRYVNAAGGLVDESQVGIVLDGRKSVNSMVTEILYWDQRTQALASPFLTRKEDGSGTVTYTARDLEVLSKDVNGDKMIEFPIVSRLPGYTSQNAAEVGNIIEWQRYDTATLMPERVMSTVNNSNDGSWFLIPDMWRGNITTVLDAEQRALTFYQWLPQETAEDENGVVTLGKRGDPLLEIRVFTAKQWDAQKGGGYFELLDNDNQVYAARLLESGSMVTDGGVELPLSMTEEDVKNSFGLLSQD